ncbi:MAG: hypothetical protein ACOX4M_09455 [Acetivibrionales bacterium]
MVAVISGPGYWKEIYEAVQKVEQEIVYKRIDVDIDIDTEVDRITIYPIGYLILDINCIDNIKRTPSAIRKLKSRNNDARVIIIATDKFTGSEVVSSLISIGVYDIIGHREYGAKTIFPSLVEHLETPATYAKAVKWDAEFRVKAKRDEPLDFIQGEGKKTIKDKIVGSIVIAVAGAMHRSGATHTAISLARFLHDNNFGVAVYEFHNSDTFQTMQNSYDEIEVKGDMFSLASIDFYPYNPDRSIADLLHGDYAYIILDMGSYFDCNISEFHRAHEKIIVCGAKDWEMPLVEEILKDEKWSHKYKYLFTFSDDDSFKFIKDNMEKLASYQAVYNPNPFSISAECGFVFEDMLKEVLPQSYFSDEKDSVFKKAISKMIKRKDTLYHNPVLKRKLLMESRSKKRKTTVDYMIKTRHSPLKIIIKVVVISAIATGIYYIAVRFNVAGEISKLFQNIKKILRSASS